MNLRSRLRTRQANPHRGAFLVVLFIGLLTLTFMAGCSQSEQFATLVIHTDLAPGTMVTLETEGNTETFHAVASLPVDATGTVEYDRLLPGEYQLTTPDPLAVKRILIPPFGLSVGGVTTLIYHTPPPTPAT